MSLGNKKYLQYNITDQSVHEFEIPSEQLLMGYSYEKLYYSHVISSSKTGHEYPLGVVDLYQSSETATHRTHGIN